MLGKRLGAAWQRFKKRTQQVAKMEHITEGPEMQQRHIALFDSPASLRSMRLMSDSDMGGKSQARFFFDESEGCAVLEGTLDLTPPPGMNNSGFAAIVTREEDGPFDLEDFDALMIEAKTDGRIFVANMKCRSVIEEDMFQAHMVSKAGEWSKIVIPFGSFIATHRGFVEGQVEMDSRSVETVGVLMAQRRPGPFRIALKSISAINRDIYQMPGKRWTGVSQDTRFVD